MNDHELDCYKFILGLVKELAEDYDAQYQHMEWFARWNLAEEIALEWIDAEGMICILESGNCVSREITAELRKIISDFELEFKKSDNRVWTHNEMKNGEFWQMQRMRAKNLLRELNVSFDG